MNNRCILRCQDCGFNTASGTDCMQYLSAHFLAAPMACFNTASGTDCMQCSRLSKMQTQSFSFQYRKRYGLHAMRHGALMSRLWVGTSFNTASGTDCMQLKEEFHHEKQCDQGFNTASGTDCMQWTALLIRKELVAVMSFNTASGTDCMQLRRTMPRAGGRCFNTASGTDCMQ